MTKQEKLEAIKTIDKIYSIGLPILQNAAEKDIENPSEIIDELNDIEYICFNAVIKDFKQQRSLADSSYYETPTRFENMYSNIDIKGNFNIWTYSRDLDTNTRDRQKEVNKVKNAIGELFNKNLNSDYNSYAKSVSDFRLSGKIIDTLNDFINMPIKDLDREELATHIHEYEKLGEEVSQNITWDKLEKLDELSLKEEIGLFFYNHKKVLDYCISQDNFDLNIVPGSIAITINAADIIGSYLECEYGLTLDKWDYYYLLYDGYDDIQVYDLEKVYDFLEKSDEIIENQKDRESLDRE